MSCVPCFWQIGDAAEVDGRRGVILHLVDHVDGDRWAVLSMGGGRHLALSVRLLELPSLPAEAP